MKKILITGFEPFGGEKINPAWEAVKRLKDRTEGRELIKLEIPTSFQKAAALVLQKMKEIEADVVISVGQAGGSYGILVERVAINMADARIPDNEDYQPVDLKIVEEGENAYFSTLDIKKLVAAVKDLGIPSEVSNSAGTYVCNYVLYSVLHAIAKSGSPTKAGFIHVPYIPQQVVEKKETASMDLESIVKALEKIVDLV